MTRNVFHSISLSRVGGEGQGEGETQRPYAPLPQPSPWKGEGEVRHLADQDWVAGRAAGAGRLLDCFIQGGGGQKGSRTPCFGQGLWSGPVLSRRLTLAIRYTCPACVMCTVAGAVSGPVRT